MNNPRHVEAIKLFSAQPDKARSEFIIDCILKFKQEDRLEAVIRQTISESLTGITLHVSASSKTPSILQPTENISDLPNELVASMDDI
jgi:hypothetical protein